MMVRMSGYTRDGMTVLPCFYNYSLNTSTFIEKHDPIVLIQSLELFDRGVE
jgi:hypothetical protein